MKCTVTDSRSVVIPNTPISKLLWNSNDDIVVYFKDGNLSLHVHYSIEQNSRRKPLPQKLRGYVSSKKKVHVF